MNAYSLNILNMNVIFITIFNVCIGVLNTVDISDKCGIDDRIEYYSTIWTEHPFPTIWIYIGLITFLFWDLITLALYTIKSIAITKT